eukprot:Lankesteria_metandrocarpae@DN10762_c0_g1_i1.p1
MASGVNGWIEQTMEAHPSGMSSWLHNADVPLGCLQISEQKPDGSTDDGKAVPVAAVATADAHGTGYYYFDGNAPLGTTSQNSVADQSFSMISQEAGKRFPLMEIAYGAGTRSLESHSTTIPNTQSYEDLLEQHTTASGTPLEKEASEDSLRYLDDVLQEKATLSALGALYDANPEVFQQAGYAWLPPQEYNSTPSAESTAALRPTPAMLVAGGVIRTTSTPDSYDSDFCDSLKLAYGHDHDLPMPDTPDPIGGYQMPMMMGPAFFPFGEVD